MADITSSNFKSLGGKSRRYEWTGPGVVQDSNGRDIAPGDTVARREYQKLIGKPLPKPDYYKRKKPKKEFENGKVWVWRFSTKSGGFTEDRFDKNKREIDQIIDSLPNSWTVQIFAQVNAYGGAEESDPEKWPWKSTLETVGDFAKRLKGRFDSTLEALLNEWGVVPSGLGDRGVNEVHVIGWNLAKVKREMSEEEKAKRKSPKSKR